MIETFTFSRAASMLRQILGAPTTAPSKPWSVILFMIAVAGTAAGVLLVYSGLRDNAEVNAYRSASSCSSPSDALGGEHCIFTGPATVIGSTRQQKLSVDLVFNGLPGRKFTATFATDREPANGPPSVGATTTAELWNGDVTRFAEIGTVDDPEFFAMNNLVPGVIFELVSLLALWWAIGFIRVAWRTPGLQSR